MSIYEKDPYVFELELLGKMDIDQKTDIKKPGQEMTNVVVLSISKKNKSCCMKTSGYEMIASSDLFLLDA